MTLLTRRGWLTGAGAACLSACASAGRDEASAGRMPAGSSSFTMRGGKGRETRVITVHCHRPASFTPDSPILIVIPGAGRNADDYRDAWVTLADAAGVLIASPSYPEETYDPAAYQMGGIIENLVTGEPQPGSTPTSIYLRDEDIRFDINPRRDEWLFGDFDRLFAELVRATGSRQRRYDLFGHSAGAQVLHRHAILWPRCRAHRVIAANAGFYTLPDLSEPLPVGLAGLGLDRKDLERAFARELTLLLGENDNDPDRGGTHLHSPRIDRQGRDRLARGRYFYHFASERARELDAEFRWKLRVVPGVGHDYRGMAVAAAKVLYG